MFGFRFTCCLCRLAAGRVPAAIVAVLLTVPSNAVWAEPDPPPATPIIVLIGGNHSDPSPEQLNGNAGRGGNSGLWRMKQDLQHQDGLEAEYFNWNGTRAGHIDAARPGGAQLIAHRLRQLRAQRPQAAVILVGNSWGGHTAWQVCRLLEGGTIEERLGTQQSINGGAPQPLPRPVPTDPTAANIQGHDAAADDAESAPAAEGEIAIDLLVLLDPSSFGRGTQPMPRVLPANVKQAVNYHTRNSFGWCGWLQDERLECIDLGDPQHGYLVAGGPQYNSLLNWVAHVAAEWDERIHLAIRRRIIGTLQTAAASGSAPSADERLRRRE